MCRRKTKMASYLTAADVQMKIGDVRIGGQPRQHCSVTTKRLKKKTRVTASHIQMLPFLLSSQQTRDKRAATRGKKEMEDDMSDTSERQGAAS